MAAGAHMRQSYSDRHGRMSGRLKSRRFIALEIRIVSREELCLQAIGLVQDRARDAFPLDGEIFPKTVHDPDDAAMDKGTPFNGCQVASNSLGESVELSLTIRPPAGKRFCKDSVALDSLFRTSSRIS